MNRRALLAFLPLLTVPACASRGEDADSSQEDLGIQVTVLSNVHVTADDASVTITYKRVLVAPFTLTLTGPNGTTTLAETSVDGATGAVFTGLDICTAYRFAIVGSTGATMTSGNIHTLQTGNVGCPASETVPPTRSYQFEAAYHWRNNAAWCSSGNYSYGWEVYPQDWPWWYVREGYMTFGYEHYWDPGAQPFPCQEQGVHVYRTSFQWDLGASRKRRVLDAAVQATVTSPQTCSNQWQAMGIGTWAYSSANLDDTNDYGEGWPDVFPAGIGTGKGMSIIQGSVPQTLTVNGTMLTLDVTSSLLASEDGSVSGGFALPNDGFPIPTGAEPSHGSYPEDNDSCLTSVADVGVALQYDAITPDTPMNCTATTNCEQFTVTCDGAPDTFEVHQEVNGADTIVGTTQGSATGSVTISGTQNLVGAPLSVCTASYGYTGVEDKLTTCTGAIPITSSIACPVTCPICPAGYTCQIGGGTAICVVNERCPPGSKYCHGTCIAQSAACFG
jgi:hypothetical protein